MSKAKLPDWESAGTALGLAWLEMIWMGHSGALLKAPKKSGLNSKIPRNGLELLVVWQTLDPLTLRTPKFRQLLIAAANLPVISDISIFLGFATHVLGCIECIVSHFL